MLHLFKKLRLYTKLGPERVDKAPHKYSHQNLLVIIVDYQHLQKYFYNWNTALNYCFIYKINIRANFIKKCRAAFDIGQKKHFFEKRASKMLPIGPSLPLLPLPPYSIPFLSVLDQKKALCNFCKKE